MIVFEKIGNLMESTVFWSLGFFIAGVIFFVSTFYVVPASTGIPLDRDKYISRVMQQLAANKTRQQEIIGVTANTADTDTSSDKMAELIDRTLTAIDKGTDDIIRWINRKEQ